MTTLQQQKEAVQLLLTKAYEHRGNDLPNSIILTEKALLQSRQLNFPDLIGKSLNVIALFQMIRGQYEVSLEMSREAIAIFKELGDEKGIADAKYNSAGVYYKTNDHHLGMIYLLDCLAIYRQLNDAHNESRTQKALGTIHEYLGDLKSAKTAYEGAITSARTAKNKDLESNAYNPLSGILLKEGEIAKAQEIINLSVHLKKETGDIRGLAFALYGLGKVHFVLKNYDEAQNDFLEALAIHQDVGDHLGMCMIHNKIAQMYQQLQQQDLAIEHLKKGVTISEKHNVFLMRYKCNYRLYEIYRADGNESKALFYLEQYLEVKDAAINSQTLKIIDNYETISKMKAIENEAFLQREKDQMVIEQERSEEASKMRQEFLSAMSHEIRTPLNAVTSIITLLKDRSSEEEKKLLTSLRFSSKNLLRIINDILDFSKLDSNKMSLEKHPVHFKVLLNNIRETYASLASEKGIELNIQISNTIGSYYKLDETKLFQILGNLISNAIKYTERGAVDIIINLVETFDHSDLIHFNVKDSGVGIPQNEKARLFESFYMPPSITTRRDGGTGLGLAIVKKLVALHDSTISIDSIEGEGSEFYFDLILEKSTAPLKRDTALYERLEGKTAILAEDNEINTIVMRELLKRWGVQMKRAKNGLEAIALAQGKVVDFILMDIHMPEMNGFDAALAIRSSDNPNKQTPIFALTADVTSANDQDYDAHFNGFLWKPIQVERL
ncbi:MAG: signal transduction histidine kinase, partial [Gammaproteobacteria bacterium]